MEGRKWVSLHHHMQGLQVTLVYNVDIQLEETVFSSRMIAVHNKYNNTHAKEKANKVNTIYSIVLILEVSCSF